MWHPPKGFPKLSEKHFSNVLFIPHTRGGAMKKKIHEWEDRMGFSDRVKVVEKTGPSLAQKEKPGDCLKKSVVYKWT